ncbi:hypothetical protein Tco_1405975 [Tanacetum coccineum]
MANFAAKYSIMTQEMVDSFCDSFYILTEVHPTAPWRDKTITQFPVGKVDIGLLDFIKTADLEGLYGQVGVGGSSSCCSVPRRSLLPTEGGQEGVAEEDAYLELRKDHPALPSGAGGKTLAGLEQIRPAGSRLSDWEQFVFPSVAPPSQESEGFFDSSARTNLWICTTVESSSALAIPVDTTAAATTSTGAAATTGLATDVNPNLAGPSHPEESEGSDDSFYAPTTLDPSEAKRWYVPRWSITNDSLLDDGFSCRTLVDRVAPPAFFSALRSTDYDQLYTKFNVGAARQVCLRRRLPEEKDLEILKLKSKLAKKEAEAVEVIHLRDQVSSLSEEKCALTAKVSALKITVTQKDHDISLLNSRATSLASTLDDAKATCVEAGHKITSLASERDRLASEVSSLRTGFQELKEMMEVQQEQQAQELYNRVAKLEAHVMDVFSHLEGEFYPT